MRKADVYVNKVLAGILTEVSPKEYVFRYDDRYMLDASRPAISLTLGKNIQEYRSEILFPFFFNMLPGNHARNILAVRHNLDAEDYFGILLATADCDTKGAVTVKPI